MEAQERMMDQEYLPTREEQLALLLHRAIRELKYPSPASKQREDIIRAGMDILCLISLDPEYKPAREEQLALLLHRAIKELKHPSPASEEREEIIRAGMEILCLRSLDGELWG